MKGKVAASAVVALLAVVVTFIKPFESGKKQHLTAYQDIVGVWTVCDGVTGPVAKPGRIYTVEQCEAMTVAAVKQHLLGVAKCLGDVSLTEGQWVALGSWAYNVGVGASCKSTLASMIRAGQPAAKWCAQLLRWDRAGGKQVRGLTRRREAEYKLCMEGAT